MQEEKVNEVNEIEEAEVIEEGKEEEVKGIEEVEDELSIANRYYYDERDFVKAAEAYAKVMETVDDPIVKLRAMYMRAECLVKQKKIREGIEAFEEVAAQEIDHYLVESAKRRAKALREYYEIE